MAATGLHGIDVQGIVPPFMLERLAKSENRTVRDTAVRAIELSAQLRTQRTILAATPALMGMMRVAAVAKKRRYIHDAERKQQLPGELVREEGDPQTPDATANEAYDATGSTYDFYKEVLGRNSIDDRGMALVSTVHYGEDYDNAFWNGAQMVFGDGDGVVFKPFVEALDIVAHEITHGVVSYTSNLVYWAESGALNESFADVFGVLVEQWVRKQTVDEADWLIGEDILVPADTRKAIRSMAAPGTAFQKDPYLGDDPQPAHMTNKYTGHEDNGGVHINSGIPNNAFYRFATALGGEAWGAPGQVWYATMEALKPDCQFKDCAVTSCFIAGQLYGSGSKEQEALVAAWDAVGLPV